MCFISFTDLFYSSIAFNLRTVNVHIDVVIITIYTETGNMEGKREGKKEGNLL